MRVEKDFEELLELLNKNKVRYCIVGAFAVAFYSRPRYTKDLDILVEPSVENAKKILEALDAFGFGSLNLSQRDFTNPKNIVQLGYEPVRVDLITSLGKMKFNEIWKTKKTGQYGKVKVHFIGLAKLLENKKSSGRKQDLADIEVLLPFKKTKR